MKPIIQYTLLITIFILPSFILHPSSFLFAQSRDAGQMVVPIGWENEDSLRFGVFDIHGFDGDLFTEANIIADSVGANFEEAFGGIKWNASLHGKRKGYMSWGYYGLYPQDTTQYFIVGDFSDLGNRIQQRIYYPSTNPIALQWDPGYYWRYNDIRFNSQVKYFDNTYDANDISLYTEYPRNDSISALTFTTRRFDIANDSTVSVGNEGRVILGYSDNRMADQMLVVNEYQKFFRWIKYDTAQTFSATLEFNIVIDSINTSGGYVSEDSLPLVRFQILFKQGNIPGTDGWSVLPFVPFKDSNNLTNPGWYKVIDTIITKQVYNSLSDTWRRPDVLENGSSARSWNFKQLHVVLKDMPQGMKNLIDPAPNDSIRIYSGRASGDSGITAYQHPDSLVAYSADFVELKKKHLLETRISSTYRATVRVRSMTWQDTISDKFLYRKPEGDSSWSCNPDGSRGGYDDLVLAGVKQLYDSCAAYGTQMREIMFNDVAQYPYGPLATSGHSYTDYMLSKRKMASHVREQDWGGHQTAQFRRERLSYDGNPPSMYENQQNIFYSNYGNSSPNVRDIFPLDYMAHAITPTLTSPWLSISSDSMTGVIIGRVDLSGGGNDTLKAYKRYTYLFGGLNNGNSDANKSFTPVIRNSTRVALLHPKGKRFAIESDIQGWGIFKSYRDGALKPHYDQRPTTPEETQSMMYSALANGVTALSIAQAYDGNGAPGIAGGRVRNPGDDFHFSTTRNFGGHYTRFGTTNYPVTGGFNLDSGSIEHYLGYANTFRASKRAISRINQIYDTNGYNKKYPFKRLEWLNAYSANKGIPTSSDTADRQTYLGSFIRAFCTTPVKRWERTTVNGYKQYIDSTDVSGNLVPDSAHRTYVEVGMFRDNPGDTLKGYAAMVVNTRLWPSLRDAEDSIYYNEGLDSAKDRSQSTLGDIDTRKAWFKLDTIAFPPNFRSSYYVIRDVWHHDTTYLVHCDSGFGVYLKPGEARLLYIEKSISIRTAPKAATAVNEFGFNNGRRVAEILGGRQSVVTYTRAGKLYVNYPGAGERFEGYNERSAGENIATGYELCIDSSTMCYRPSICAGMNDTAVAITYWTSQLGGRVKVAYQKKPYDPWVFATANDLHVPDTTSDHSGVTPVIAPYAELPKFHAIDSSHLAVFKDSIWLVAATYLNLGTKATGIVCFRFKVNSSGIQYLDDTPDQFFHSDGPTSVLKDRSAFPTITSRALSSIRGDYPVRLAWQKSGKIFYNRYRDISLVLTPAAPQPECISDGLPSLCYNYHPSIAMNCVKVNLSSSVKGDGTAQMAYVAGGPFPDTNIFMHDYVVWESKLNGKKWNSGTHFWPVLRSRYQKLEWPAVSAGKWNSFQVFKPKIDTTDFHWPIVSAGSRVDTFFSGSTYAKNLKAYHDRMRIAWFDDAVDSMEFVHYPNSIKRTILNEGGTRPSLPQPTYYLKRMSDSSMVQPSVAFMGLQKDGSLNHVRITNGWFPMVSTAKKALIFPSIQIIIKADTITQCPQVVKKVDIGPPSIIKSGGGNPQVNWRPTDVGGDLAVFPNDWPVTPTNPVEFSSDTFRVSALDSIIVPRKLDSLDLTSLRNGLRNSSDYYMQKIMLRRHMDSSYVGTVDSIYISTTAARYPGNGLDPTFARYEYPFGMPTDSVFLSIEVLRGHIGNQLERGFIEYIQEDDITTMAFKQAPDEPVLNANQERIPITMEIYPNPLSLKATVEVVTPNGTQTLIELYDINGKRTLTLFEGSSSGKLTLTLDGKDLTNGIYFLRTQCGNSVVTKKVELIK